MSTKLLISGPAGAGKTSLLSTLGKETFVISRDAKNFTFPIPHMLVDTYINMDTFIHGGVTTIDGEKVEVPGVVDKLNAYVERMGQPPEIVVFDSVSQIFMDVIDVASQKPNVYGSQGAEVTSEIAKLTKFIHEELELNGITVVLLNHIIEEKVDGKKTGAWVPFGSGKFLEKGGFYSTANEAITIVPDGAYRAIYTRGIKKQARTFFSEEEVPSKMFLENTDGTKSKQLKDGEQYFTLKWYIDKLLATQSSTDEFRL